jgi:hypothetical protein
MCNNFYLSCFHLLMCPSLLSLVAASYVITVSMFPKCTKRKLLTHDSHCWNKMIKDAPTFYVFFISWRYHIFLYVLYVMYFYIYVYVFIKFISTSYAHDALILKHIIQYVSYTLCWCMHICIIIIQNVLVYV